jgi:ATP-dependent DNA ligase
MPTPVMLARLEETIPAEAALPGGVAYEPKWDGFRLLAQVLDEGEVRLWSRRGTDLTSGFPEVVDALRTQVPAGTVLDGEVVIWEGDRLAFGLLQSRLTKSPRTVERLARETPASFVGFDVLWSGGQDLRPLPWDERRRQLEAVASGWSPPLNLSPVTYDEATARVWFRDLAVAGIEGLVVKGRSQAYLGERRWLKVKHRNTLEVVCAAVVGLLNRPNLIVAGLPLDEGAELAIVGRTVPLSAAESKLVGSHLSLPVGPHPWPREVPSSTANGYGASRDSVKLTRVEPVVVEVSADVAWTGSSFRHPLRFVRLRPDMEPSDVALPPFLA